MRVITHLLHWAMNTHCQKNYLILNTSTIQCTTSIPRYLRCTEYLQNNNSRFNPIYCQWLVNLVLSTRFEKPTIAANKTYKAVIIKNKLLMHNKILCSKFNFPYCLIIVIILGRINLLHQFPLTKVWKMLMILFPRGKFLAANITTCIYQPSTDCSIRVCHTWWAVHNLMVCLAPKF